MLKQLLMSASLLSLSLPLVAADQPASIKLAVVDFQKALNSVEEGKAAKAKLEKEFAAKKKDVESKEGDINKIQNELEGLQKQVQSGLLKPEQTSSIMEKGRKLETELRRKIEENLELRKKHQQEMAEKETKATGEILTRLKQIAQDVGRTEGFTMILEQNASGLVYASSYTDVTERIIQKYNSQHKPKN